MRLRRRRTFSIDARLDAGRRRLLLASLALPALALPGLQGCESPLPALRENGTMPAARELLRASSAAHGLRAYMTFTDLSVSYAGQWGAVVGKLQPALVDPGFRGGSQERLLLRENLVAQAHTGPSGRKQVVRRTAAGTEGDVRVWFNGEEAHDAERLAAAALVVDGYSLFLLGPLVLTSQWAAERSFVMELNGTSRLQQAGRAVTCDVLRIRMAPGLGFSDSERLALFIDRDEQLLRRVRFTLDGLESTRGAIAEVDTFEHVTLHGVRWPTRFHERLLRPLPLSVHDWRLTGLDVDRGMQMAEVNGAEFSGKALVPAAPCTP